MQKKHGIGYSNAQLEESQKPSFGFKELSFAHEFDHSTNTEKRIIDFASLNEPVAWGEVGLAQPTAGDILASSLGFFKGKVQVESEVRGLIPKTKYRVTSSQIRLTFDSLPDETFIVSVGNVQKSGIQLVDARPIYRKGTLPEGQTTFNVGDSFFVGLDPQSVKVHRRIPGELFDIMGRNTDNSSTVLDKDYYEVGVFEKLGSAIEFNLPGSVGGDEIIVESIGALVEKPDLSMMQTLDAMNGVLSKVKEDALAAFGFDVTDPNRYNGAPTKFDLELFGNRVLALEALYDVAVKISTYTKTLVRENLLPADVTSDGVIAPLTFSLEVGKAYRVGGQFAMQTLLPGEDAVFMFVDDGAQRVATPAGTSEDSGSIRSGINAIFVATTTSLTCSASSASPTTSRIVGDGTKSATFLQLEELPNHEFV